MIEARTSRVVLPPGSGTGGTKGAFAEVPWNRPEGSRCRAAGEYPADCRPKRAERCRDSLHTRYVGSHGRCHDFLFFTETERKT